MTSSQTNRAEIVIHEFAVDDYICGFSMEKCGLAGSYGDCMIWP
jgi:hypothetical protein